ncbi:MAG: YabP/YqfC family sporulation protein [Tenericutes bacterium]|nr:YabP/YqfC family sporulation protein [Mycoplasmatota bacterium]
MFDKIREYVKDEEFRLTIYRDRVYAVNYSNILTLTDSRVTLKVEDVMYVIKGENLVLNKLLDKEILINGKIFDLEVFYD